MSFYISYLFNYQILLKFAQKKHGLNGLKAGCAE